MKKMKKLFAILMTMAMVMGLSITGFAEPKKPEARDAATGTVANVEATAIVTAYQIVEATYNTSGFTGYKVVDAVSDSNTKIADKHNPTPVELTAIAKNDTLLDNLKKVSMTAGQATDDGFCDFTAELNAGYWLVLVTGDSDHDIKEVYNPMLLGIYYTGTGSSGELTTDPDELDANSSWTIGGAVVYAKSSSVPITKTANVETADLGDEIKFTIDTTVPYYSDEYDTESLQFAVSDTLKNLALVVDSTDHQFKVEKEAASGVYEPINSSNFDYGVDENESPNPAPATEDTSFEVSFDSIWIKQNGGANIRITYYATLMDGALNTTPGSNDATVTYTNDPSGTTDSNKDTEKVYTFDIDGDVTADILKKVKPGTTEGTTEALKGATFTLYTNSECTNIYTNSKGNGVASSDPQGKITFTGLAAGTYYLKETAAPNGYTLNDTVYEITISATIQNEELSSWTYTVKPYGSSDDNVATSTFNVSAGTATAAEENTTTEIMNTTLTELPSTGGMGTTLFTIAGCVIMISAAGLFFATRKKAN